MVVVCLDLEGILMPEIWPDVAKITGIETLTKTTRDIPDYDELMKSRLEALNKHKITFKDIQDVICEINPLPGAVEFANWIRQNYQLIILSDTYQEFFQLMQHKLGMPTIFCHTLKIGTSGMIDDYQIRLPDHKRKTVESLKQLNYRVIASGDSFNDVSMLKAADCGILFRSPEHFKIQFPEFPATQEYEELKSAIILSEKKIRN